MKGEIPLEERFFQEHVPLREVFQYHYVSSEWRDDRQIVQFRDDLHQYTGIRRSDYVIITGKQELIVVKGEK